MNFERGKKKAPSGNLIIYCEVIGQNPIDQDAKIIAANIVVSFLTNDDTLPAITFPPIPFQSLAEFNSFLLQHLEYDVIKIETFQFPADSEKAQDYVNERLQRVNDLVKNYVHVCSAYLKGVAVVVSPDDLNGVLDKLEYIEQIAEESAEQGKDLKQQNQYQKFLKFFHGFINENPQYPIHNLPRYMSKTDTKSRQLVSLFIQQSKAIYLENYEEAKELQSKIATLTE